MKSSGTILFICAGLLLGGGAVLGGSVTWSLLRTSHYFWTTDLGVELGASVLFVVASLLCLPTCWLAATVPYHAKSTSLVATLIALSMSSMLLLSLGISSLGGLSRAVREPAALNTSMLRAMSLVNDDQTVYCSFADMQLELKCCGVQSSADWLQYRGCLPTECCGRRWNGKCNDVCTSPLYATGCLRPALLQMRTYVNSITSIASTIIIVMAVTLFAGAYTLVCEELDGGADQKPHAVAGLPRLPSVMTFTSAPLAHV